MKRALIALVAVLTVFAPAAAGAEGWYFRTNRSGQPGYSISAYMPAPYQEPENTLFNWASYDETQCHVAFERGGLAYSSLRIAAGEEIIVCLWSGSLVEEGLHWYDIHGLLPAEKRATMRWFGPSGEMRADVISPVGVTDWYFPVLAQVFPTERENWNTVAWRGYCRIYNPTAVPEPSSLILFVSGLGSIGLWRRRR